MGTLSPAHLGTQSSVHCLCVSVVPVPDASKACGAKNINIALAEETPHFGVPTMWVLIGVQKVGPFYRA